MNGIRVVSNKPFQDRGKGDVCVSPGHVVTTPTNPDILDIPRVPFF